MAKSFVIALGERPAGTRGLRTDSSNPRHCRDESPPLGQAGRVWHRGRRRSRTRTSPRRYPSSGNVPRQARVVSHRRFPTAVRTVLGFDSNGVLMFNPHSMNLAPAAVTQSKLGRFHLVFPGHHHSEYLLVGHAALHIRVNGMLRSRSLNSPQSGSR